MLPAGTASALNYASRLYLLPIGVFAISLSVVIFPTLSQAVVKNQKKRVKNTIQKGLNMLAFLIIPSSTILMGYAEQIVTLVYKRGNFSDKGVIITAGSLKFYALGLLFFSTIHLLTRSHYVYKDRTLPVISSFVAIFINIILDFLLYKQYRHIGLTVATSFSAMINYLILLISLNKRHIKINNLIYLKFLVLSLVISLASFYISNMIKVSTLGKFGILINITVFGLLYLAIWSVPIMLSKPKK